MLKDSTVVIYLDQFLLDDISLCILTSSGDLLVVLTDDDPAVYGNRVNLLSP